MWSAQPRADITTRNREEEEEEEIRPACTDCTHSGQQTSDWKYFYNLEQQPTPSALCSVRAMSVSADLIYRSDAGAGAVAFTQSLAILIIYEVSTLYITSLHSTTTPTPPADTTKGDTGCDQIPITSQSPQYFNLLLEFVSIE